MTSYQNMGKFDGGIFGGGAIPGGALPVMDEAGIASGQAFWYRSWKSATRLSASL